MERTSSKSRLATTLLALFLGGFGVHRFYVGKVGSGIVMLILTCTIIGAIVSGIWALIDLIVAISGQFRDADNYRIANW